MSGRWDGLPLSRSGRQPLEVATQAIKEAGRTLMKHFLLEKKVRVKGRGNIVTSVDYLVESGLVEFLHREFPNFGILSEESVDEKGTTGYTWITDPLDGTRNYASRLPHFSVTLALVRGEDILVGLVYDPLRNELFYAERGSGAYLNGKPIQVSEQPSVEMSVVGLDMGYDDDKAHLALEMVTALWPGMQSLRIMGSAALGLAYAAAGRLDIYVHHFLYPWDIASGILLVQEAGGKVTDRLGGPVSWRSQGVIAAGEAVHDDFLRRTTGFSWRAK
ncbi:MAG: inositol monophosphatase [Chloroflexi bacterium]|nr:inositol monophosphatase [Chloroflexota bacterium]